MEKQWAAGRWTVRVSLPPAVSDRQRRELGAFVQYCVRRIGRELRALRVWSVSLISSSEGYASVVRVRVDGQTIEGRGIGVDAALTIYEAMCRLEQAARDRRPAQRVLCM